MKNWMEKAEHALRTGQPRLAELYMRRGLSETADGRAWLARRDALAVFEAVGVELRDWMMRCVEALGLAADSTQSDFALVGPSRG